MNAVHWVPVYRYRYRFRYRSHYLIHEFINCRITEYEFLWFSFLDKLQCPLCLKTYSLTNEKENSSNQNFWVLRIDILKHYFKPPVCFWKLSCLIFELDVLNWLFDFSIEFSSFWTDCWRRDTIRLVLSHSWNIFRNTRYLLSINGFQEIFPIGADLPPPHRKKFPTGQIPEYAPDTYFWINET